MNPISGLRITNPFATGAQAVQPQGLKPGGISTQELGNLGSITTPQGPQANQPGRSFSHFLGEMTQEVNAKKAAASDAVQGVLTGQNVPLHSAMLAIEEASVSFQLMVEVRNKLLDSYQELMRMQI